MLEAALFASALPAFYGIICLATNRAEKISIRIGNPVFPTHLRGVKEEMRKLGAPTLRAVRTADGWFAFEGSHRVTAAAELGCGIQLIEIGPDELVVDHQIVDHEQRDCAPLTGRQIAEMEFYPTYVSLPLRKVTFGRTAS
jgi:hypothetical protein